MSSFKRRVLEATIGRIAFRSVTATAVREIAPRFWRIDLAGDDLKGIRARPGDKLQVSLDDGSRTYSPFDVDAAKGRLSVVAFAHGSSSGAQWGPTAKVGDTFQIFGPRSSIGLDELRGNIVLAGDETALGIARALHDHAGDGARYVIEATDVAAATAALRHLGVPSPVVVARATGSTFDEAIRAALRERSNAHLVLTGNARMIQLMRTSLAARPVPHAGQRVKAYWAPGKRGLD